MPTTSLCGVVLHWLLTVHWAVARRRATLRAEMAASSAAGYLIASFPSARQVNYARLPDTAWLPLIPSEGITSPEALAVDPSNMRLFVADPSVGLVYWYQLELLQDGRLVSDGAQRLAASSVSAKGLAVDGLGDLYISGQGRGTSSTCGIFKQDAVSFAAHLPPLPTAIWTPSNTNVTGHGVQLAMPRGIAVDTFHVYWGNAMRGENCSSVVQAATTAPDGRRMQAAAYQSAIKAALHPLADNADEVRGLALTPEGIVYAAPDGVYGVRLRNAGQGCGQSNASCPLISSVQDPTSLVWDADGTVLVADRGTGSVFSFPSGTMDPHTLQKVTSAPGIHGLTMLSQSVTRSGARELGLRGALVMWMAWAVLMCVLLT
mmetsp:Transcript_55578/g.165245  ORF Transcript_55578/g.165245 Transcript_55578/m.165245 type:complete len:375 (-) Transcript_55578:153-1277(-)